MIFPPRYVPTGQTFAGSQGAVIVCTDTFLDREVAIKVYDSATDERALQKELQGLTAVTSKHVVAMYDMFSEEGEVAFVQEALPGQDLQSWGGRSKPLEDFIKILYQVSTGLSDIHEAGIIHRDIKPRNMKFSASGIVKIYDFGVSNSPEDEHTMIGAGTRSFRAPELFDTAPIRITNAIDIYSLGASVWQILDGAMPSSLRMWPPRPQDCNSFGTHPLNLPDDIVELLDRCLNATPSERPSAQEIKQACHDCLVKGKHRAFATASNSQTYTLDKDHRIITINHGGNTCTIAYDLKTFSVTALQGLVSINGLGAQIGTTLPNSCVITLGSNNRYFIPFDVSHPEVVL